VQRKVSLIKRRLPLLVGLAICHIVTHAQSTDEGARTSASQAGDVNSDSALPKSDQKTPAGKATAPVALQQVVITAERRPENLQRTAVSVTVLDGAALQQQGKTDIAQIVEFVPGVVYQNLKPDGAPLLSVRGVGTDNPMGNAAVALYVDGVANKQGAGQFFDMQRVEVLRGPQGTLYGRGAPGGAVNFVTNDPGNKLEGNASFELGSDRLRRVIGVVNVPISEAWSARVAVNKSKRDGYFDNGLSDLDESTARIKLKYQPNKDFSTVFGYVSYRNRSLGEGQVALDSNNDVPALISNATTTAGLGLDESYRKFTVNANWNLGLATLTYVGSHSNYDMNSTTYFGGNQNIAVFPTDRANTHEIRLSSNTRKGLTWIAGLYGANTAYEGSRAIFSPPIFNGDFGTDASQSTRAIFGEMGIPVAEDWRFTVGARYSHDTYSSNFPQTFKFLVPNPPPDMNFADVRAAAKFNHSDYKLRVEKTVTQDSMLYASLSTGYRPGGAASNGDGTTQMYGIEVNKAVELGTKNRFLNGRAQLNASVYHYDYSGFQQTYQAPGSPFVTIQSHPASFWGGEIESKVLLTRDDELTVNFALATAKYTDISTPVPHAPKRTVGMGYMHSFTLDNGASLGVGGDLKYQSSSYTNFSNVADAGMFQRAYTLYNLSANYESSDSKYTVTGYVKNLSNKLYKLSVVTQAGPGLPELATVGSPRTFGVMVGVNF
jgi:iron complex outermembrane recepter protein